MFVVRYFKTTCFIVVCSTAKMDFLAEIKKRVAAHTDCEIIDVEPLSFKVPEKVDKGKAVATVPQKMKITLPQVPCEKLMKNAMIAGMGSEALEAMADPTGGGGAGGRFVLAWRLAWDTKLGIVAERQEWAMFALPPRVRAGFNKNTDRDIEAKSNAAVVEVSW